MKNRTILATTLVATTAILGNSGCSRGPAVPLSCEVSCSLKTVKARQDVDYQFTVRNSGSQDITIPGIEPTAGLVQLWFRYDDAAPFDAMYIELERVAPPVPVLLRPGDVKSYTFSLRFSRPGKVEFYCTLETPLGRIDSNRISLLVEGDALD